MKTFDELFPGDKIYKSVLYKDRTIQTTEQTVKSVSIVTESLNWLEHVYIVTEEGSELMCLSDTESLDYEPDDFNFTDDNILYKVISTDESHGWNLCLDRKRLIEK